jgi:hypothetical protein
MIINSPPLKKSNVCVIVMHFFAKITILSKLILLLGF